MCGGCSARQRQEDGGADPGTGLISVTGLLSVTLPDPDAMKQRRLFAVAMDTKGVTARREAGVRDRTDSLPSLGSRRYGRRVGERV